MSLLERSMQVAAPFGRYFETLMRVPRTLHEAGEVAASVARSSEHVVLIPGYSSIRECMNPLKRTLEADGFAVHMARVPNNGLGDAREAADLVAGMISGIRAADPTAGVHLVGHSRGGMIARDVAVRYGASQHIDSLIVLGSPQNGVRVTFPGIAKSRLMDPFIPESRLQLLAGSDYVQSLGSRALEQDGTHLASIYVDHFDGAVRPSEAHVAAAGWHNVAVPVGGPFPHLSMITNDRITYRQLAAELAMSIAGRTRAS